MTRFDTLLRPAALLLLSALPGADTIHREDGAPIEDVEIDEETITSVTYEDDGRLESIPSEKVVRVEFSRPPEEIDAAETAAVDGDLELARDDLRSYLEDVLGGSRERKKWAPPYAAKRVVELSDSLGDREGVVRAADVLLENFPESRYLPQAYLAKANAQIGLGRDDAANATLTEFQDLIVEQGLSSRWRLECELALVQTDASLGAEARREKLAELATSAGDEFPGVRHRARLGLGELLVAQATRAGGAKRQLLSEARPIFEKIVEDRYAADDVLAGAHTGLGDCLFYGEGDEEARLEEAGLHYLRVTVLYEDATRYVAKAMFYAGRCYDQLDTPEDKSRARDLYTRVLRLFPSSAWAEEARNFLR